MTPSSFLHLMTKPLRDFSPTEFKEYVRSLFVAHVSVPSRKEQKDLLVRVRRLKKGGLSVTTRRSPKYVTRSEYSTFAKEFPENELFLALRAAGFEIRPSHEVVS